MDQDTEHIELSEVAGKYLLFDVGAASYGISVYKIREILTLPSLSPVPETPDYMKGVMDFRGTVVPVIDLRVKFGLRDFQTKERDCVIVVRVERGGGYFDFGLVVDSVKEVLSIKGEQIEEVPEACTDLENKYLLGMCTMNGQFKTLLDIDKVVNANDLVTVVACGANL